MLRAPEGVINQSQTIAHSESMPELDRGALLLDHAVAQGKMNFQIEKYFGLTEAVQIASAFSNNRSLLSCLILESQIGANTCSARASEMLTAFQLTLAEGDLIKVTLDKRDCIDHDTQREIWAELISMPFWKVKEN